MGLCKLKEKKNSGQRELGRDAVFIITGKSRVCLCHGEGVSAQGEPITEEAGWPAAEGAASGAQAVARSWGAVETRLWQGGRFAVRQEEDRGRGGRKEGAGANARSHSEGAKPDTARLSNEQITRLFSSYGMAYETDASLLAQPPRRAPFP